MRFAETAGPKCSKPVEEVDGMEVRDSSKRSWRGGWWVVGGAGGKRAVAAANLSRANGSLHHSPGSQRETQKQQALYLSGERLLVCSLFFFTDSGRSLFPLSLFLVLTCAVSDCVRQDKG